MMKKVKLQYPFIVILSLAVFQFSCKAGFPEKKQTITTVAAQEPKAGFADSVTNKIDALVKKLAIDRHCRITLKLANGGGDAYYAGFDGRTGQPIADFTGTIEIGSCTKMFTATAILQLIEQKKLSLQDKLVKILPNDSIYKNLLVINGRDYVDSVSILNLLNHSSGLPDYFIEGDDATEIKKHGDSSLHFTPYDLVALAKNTNKPSFKPGTSFKYCNLNYIFLGMIIEKLSGITWQQYVQAHILNPLKLQHSFFGSVNPPAKRAAGYYNGKIAVMPATMAGSAGEIISTLDDMQAFISAWNKGALFANTETLHLLKNDYYLDMVPGMITYGMGVFRIMNLVQGHAGQTFGYQSFMGVTNNNYSFAFGIDDASVSAFEMALGIAGILN